MTLLDQSVRLICMSDKLTMLLIKMELEWLARLMLIFARLSKMDATLKSSTKVQVSV